MLGLAPTGRDKLKRAGFNAFDLAPEAHSCAAIASACRRTRRTASA